MVLMKKSEELKTAIDIAKRAGEILMDNYGDITVNYKKDGTIVTNADIESERFIISMLSEKFPEFSILSEESNTGKRNLEDSEYLWVVDPLDGTTNYSIKNPFFDISIALTYKSKPIVGIVYYPFQDEMFYAESGKGAYLNDKNITVSDKDDIRESVHTFCHASDELSTLRMAEIWKRLKLLNPKVRQIGAGALELSYTACGRVDSFMMININPWDVAAGTLLVREAGGMVTDFSGNEFDITHNSILASNGRLHKKLLDIINYNK